MNAFILNVFNLCEDVNSMGHPYTDTYIETKFVINYICHYFVNY